MSYTVLYCVLYLAVGFPIVGILEHFRSVLAPLQCLGNETALLECPSVTVNGSIGSQFQTDEGGGPDFSLLVFAGVHCQG